MSTPSSPPGVRGRPRSTSADAAILEATLEVLAEVGWTGLTVEGVALRAGVAKTTVYRRYSSRTELAVEALGSLVEAIRVETDDDISPVELTRRAIQSVGDVYRIPAVRAAYLAVVAEAGHDPELRTAVDARVLAPARQLVVERLATAVQRGELEPDVARTQVDLLFDVLAGALLHRLLVREREADDAFVDSLTHAVLVALGIEPQKHLPPRVGDPA